MRCRNKNATSGSEVAWFKAGKTEIIDFDLQALFLLLVYCY